LRKGGGGLVRHTDSDARMEGHPEAQVFSKLVCCRGVRALAWVSTSRVSLSPGWQPDPSPSAPDEPSRPTNPPTSPDEPDVEAPGSPEQELAPVRLHEPPHHRCKQRARAALAVIERGGHHST
jgi:hypothetical protein